MTPDSSRDWTIPGGGRVGECGCSRDPRAEAGGVERLDECVGVEVTGDLEGRRPGFGRIAGDAVHDRDRPLDGLATRPAAVVYARHLNAFLLALGNVAHGLHR